MAEPNEVLYDKQRSGVLITLNRPEAMNAATRPMIRKLSSALDDAVADPEVRAIVLTGSGRGFWFQATGAVRDREDVRSFSYAGFDQTVDLG